MATVTGSVGNHPLMVAARNVGELDGPPYLGTGTELTDFITTVGVSPSVVGYYVDFTTPFITTKPDYIHSLGAVPSLTWEPWDHADPGHEVQPAYQLADITAGTYDTYITNFANAMKAWGIANSSFIYLRFAHEMNGSWYPWAEAANGNSAGDYVLAWRHVWNIFNSVGANPYVSWQWCPNVDPSHFFTPLAGLYPGDSYVNGVGMDGYNFGTAAIEGWLTPTQVFEQTRLDIEAITAKPLRIWETGSVEYVAGSAFLEDDFNGASLNTALWNGGSFGFVSQSGGKAVIPCTTSYYVIGTVAPPAYDLTSHYAQVQVIPPAVGTGTREHFFQFFLDGSNYFQWILSGTTLLAQKIVAGATTTGATLTYNATTHAYWKIENSGANIIFSTSTNGTVWTAQYTVATPFAITALDVYLGSGYYGTETASNCLFDNFTSTLPRVAASGTKEQWIEQLCDYVGIHSDILAYLWFEFDNGLDTPGDPDFRIETSPASTAAFVACFHSGLSRGSMSATGTIVKVGSASLTGSSGFLTAIGLTVRIGQVTMTGVGTLSATGTFVITGSAVLTGTSTMTVTVVDLILLFFPPVRLRRSAAIVGGPLYARTMFANKPRLEGVNVYILTDGTVTEKDPFNAPPHAEAERTFYGGHDPYVITSEEASLLLAAGYLIGSPQP